MTHHTTRLVEMIFPEQANHYGTLFGGNALNLLSKAAFLVANAPTLTAFAAPPRGCPLAWGGPAPASRHARGDVVMAACSEVKFLAPVRLGQALALTARITRTGRSSMTVRVEGAAETLASGESHPALEGSFEMVAVDAQGRARHLRTFQGKTMSPHVHIRSLPPQGAHASLEAARREA